MNCNTVILPKRYCYCTVSIAGLIDNFFGLGGGGVTEKNLPLLGWGGSWEKNLMTGGVMQLFNDSSKNPTSPPLPHKKRTVPKKHEQIYRLGF